MVSLRKLARTGHVSTQAIDARQLAGVTEDESSFSLFRSKPSYLTALYSVFYTSILNTTGDNSQEKLSKYHPSRLSSNGSINADFLSALNMNREQFKRCIQAFFPKVSLTWDLDNLFGVLSCVRHRSCSFSSFTVAILIILGCYSDELQALVSIIHADILFLASEKGAFREGMSRFKDPWEVLSEQVILERYTCSCYTFRSVFSPFLTSAQAPVEKSLFQELCALSLKALPSRLDMLFTYLSLFPMLDKRDLEQKFLSEEKTYEKKIALKKSTEPSYDPNLDPKSGPRRALGLTDQFSRLLNASENAGCGNALLSQQTTSVLSLSTFLQELVETGHIAFQAVESYRLSGFIGDGSILSSFRRDSAHSISLYRAFYEMVLKTNSQEKLVKYHPSKLFFNEYIDVGFLTGLVMTCEQFKHGIHDIFPKAPLSWNLETIFETISCIQHNACSFPSFAVAVFIILGCYSDELQALVSFIHADMLRLAGEKSAFRKEISHQRHSQDVNFSHQAILSRHTCSCHVFRSIFSPFLSPAEVPVEKSLFQELCTLPTIFLPSLSDLSFLYQSFFPVLDVDDLKRKFLVEEKLFEKKIVAKKLADSSYDPDADPKNGPRRVLGLTDQFSRVLNASENSQCGASLRLQQADNTSLHKNAYPEIDSEDEAYTSSEEDTSPKWNTFHASVASKPAASSEQDIVISLNIPESEENAYLDFQSNLHPQGFFDPSSVSRVAGTFSSSDSNSYHHTDGTQNSLAVSISSKSKADMGTRPHPRITSAPVDRYALRDSAALHDNEHNTVHASQMTGYVRNGDPSYLPSINSQSPSNAESISYPPLASTPSPSSSHSSHGYSMGMGGQMSVSGSLLAINHNVSVSHSVALDSPRGEDMTFELGEANNFISMRRFDEYSSRGSSPPLESDGEFHYNIANQNQGKGNERGENIEDMGTNLAASPTSSLVSSLAQEYYAGFAEPGSSRAFVADSSEMDAGISSKKISLDGDINTKMEMEIEMEDDNFKDLLTGLANGPQIDLGFSTTASEMNMGGIGIDNLKSEGQTKEYDDATLVASIHTPEPGSMELSGSFGDDISIQVDDVRKFDAVSELVEKEKTRREQLTQNAIAESEGNENHLHQSSTFNGLNTTELPNLDNVDLVALYHENEQGWDEHAIPGNFGGNDLLEPSTADELSVLEQTRYSRTASALHNGLPPPTVASPSLLHNRDSEGDDSHHVVIDPKDIEVDAETEGDDAQYPLRSKSDPNRPALVRNDSVDTMVDGKSSDEHKNQHVQKPKMDDEAETSVQNASTCKCNCSIM